MPESGYFSRKAESPIRLKIAKIRGLLKAGEDAHSVGADCRLIFHIAQQECFNLVQLLNEERRKQ